MSSKIMPLPIQKMFGFGRKQPVPPCPHHHHHPREHENCILLPLKKALVENMEMHPQAHVETMKKHLAQGTGCSTMSQPSSSLSSGGCIPSSILIFCSHIFKISHHQRSNTDQYMDFL